MFLVFFVLTRFKCNRNLPIFPKNLLDPSSGQKKYLQHNARGNDWKMLYFYSLTTLRIVSLEGTGSSTSHHVSKDYLDV